MTEIQSIPASGQRSFRLPFTHLGRAAWVRLALASLAALYGITILWSAWFSGVGRHLGGDFGTYMASAQIVRDHGFAAVYDLSLQKAYQNAVVYPDGPPEQDTVLLVPTPYLPPFVASFLPFLIFGPLAGWWLWAVGNTLALLAYVQRLTRAAGVRREVALAFALCLPAYLNLFYDQVNVWLLICLGEALLAARRERNLSAGLWLTGMLIKPQTLLLLIPGLALRREWRMLFGFGMGAAAIGVASLWLAGVDGMLALARLIAGYANADGLPSNTVEAMMNWRAAAWYLERWVPGIDWTMVAIVAALLTSVAALGLWLKHAAPASAKHTQIWLGTYAATCVVAWHSHAFTALPLIAPAILAWGDSRSGSRVLSLWLWGPLVLFVGVHYIVGPVAIALGIGEWALPSLRTSANGMGLLAANLVVLGWVCYELLWLPRRRRIEALSTLQA